MWYRTRIAVCDICGKESQMKKDIDGIWHLPGGWSGNSRKYGECFKCR